MTETTTDLVVLHTLRCIGFAGLERVAEVSALSEPDAESELIDLAVAGLVTRTRGPGGFATWGLTDAGKAEDERRIAAELDEAGAREAVLRAYENFLQLNPELLDLCSAWQMRTVDGVPTINDHTDRAYDQRVLHRFADLDARAAPVCAELAAALPRFGRYRERFTEALGRARGGALEHLTDTTASYHNVWFQLHEDLLATLGIPR